MYKNILHAIVTKAFLHSPNRNNARSIVAKCSAILLLLTLLPSVTIAQNRGLIVIDSTTTQRAGGKSVTVIHFYACEPFMMNGAMRTENFYTNFSRGSEEVTYYVTYTATARSSETQNACDSYIWNYTSGKSKTYTIPGTFRYEETVQNAVCAPMLQGGTNVATYTYGPTYCKCDSIKTLNLTLKKSSSATITDIACDNFFWPVNNQTYTQTTTGQATLRNKQGCDSNVTLHITINKSSSSEYTTTKCNSYTWYGQTYTSSATLTHSSPNAKGCDSTETLHLTINRSTAKTITVDTCDTYTWRPYNVTYTSSQSTQRHETNAKGCDSTVTLNLTIRKKSTSTVHEAIIQRQLPYTYHTLTITDTDGVSHAQVIIPNAQGCDSIIDYTLTVYPTVQNEVDSFVCREKLNAGFTWNNIPFYDEGSRTITLEGAHGADSILRMVVSAYKSYYPADTHSICQGHSFTWQGQNFSYNDMTTTQTKVYTKNKNFRSVHNCDSNFTLRLIVNPVRTTTLNKTICKNNPYSFCGTQYNTSGDYVCHLQTTNGCDSTVTLKLTVKDTSTSEVSASIVQNDLRPYTYWDQSYTLSDFNNTDDLTRIARAAGRNRVGCDSVITYHLHLYRNVYDTADSNVCATILTQQSLYWNGHRFWDAGAQSVKLRNRHGADSNLYMRVHRIENPTRTFNDTVLENSLPITRYGRTFYSATTRTQTIQIENPGGCDSIIYYNLYVKQNTLTVIDTFICDNMFPITWHNHTFAADGWQYDTVIATDGTDSILAYHINKWLTYDNQYNKTICNNQTYTFSGVTYNTTGVYRHDGFHSIHGCDSAATLTLTVNPVTYGVQYDTIIENHLSDQHGGYYTGWTWHPYYYCYERYGQCFRDSVSHYTITLREQNRYRCDSILDFNIFVYWNRDTTLYDTICGDDLSYTWNAGAAGSKTFTASQYGGNPKQGTYTQTIKINTTLKSGTSERADSTIKLTLTVHPSYHVVEPYVRCANDMLVPFVWRDTVLPIGAGSDTIDQERYSIYGCDSNYRLELTVHGNTATDFYDTVVENRVKAGYHFAIITIYDTNTIRDSIIIIPNAHGCDSIINYNLYVHKNVRGIDSTIICHELLMPQGWEWNNAKFITDSLPPSTEEGKSRDGFIVMDGTIPAHTGADSTITMTVKVLPTYSHYRNDTICDDTAAFFMGRRKDKTGDDQQTLRTMHQCDSTWYYHVQVWKTYRDTLYDTIYEDAFRAFGGHAYNDIGRHTYVDSLHSIHNCDSVINLNLLVNRKTFVDSSICLNTLPITWNEMEFTRATTLQTHFRTVSEDSILNDLDSLVVMTLYTRDTSATYDTRFSCDSFTWRNGNKFYEDNTADTVKLINALNCDSVIHLVLTMYYSHPDTHYHQNCNTYTWINGITYDASILGPQQMLRTTHDCDSLVTLDLEINYTTYEEWYDSICDGMALNFRGRSLSAQGTYYDSLTTVKGCDSITAQMLTVLPTPTIELVNKTDCEAEKHYIHVLTDVDYIRWSAYPDDGSIAGHEHDSVLVVTPEKNTTYSLYADYREQTLCPTSTTITLRKIVQPTAMLKTSPDYFTYQDVKLRAIDMSPVKYERRWYVNGILQADDSSIFETEISPTYSNIVVKLEVLTNYCVDTATYTIPVLKPTLYVPNTFTPGEQSNNIFRVQGSEILDFEMYIYNRRGQIVFHTYDINQGWDGRFEGMECPQGAYVYRLRYRNSIIQNSWESMSGTLLLIR